MHREGNDLNEYPNFSKTVYGIVDLFRSMFTKKRKQIYNNLWNSTRVDITEYRYS